MLKNLLLFMVFSIPVYLSAAEITSSQKVDPNFYNFKHTPPGQAQQILIAEKFGKIDKDRSGFLDVKEVEQEIYNYLMIVAKAEEQIDPKLRQLKISPQEYAKNLIKNILSFDHDGDGKISINEFQKWHQLSGMK